MSPRETSHRENAVKYAPGIGPRVRDGNRTLQPLEWVVIGHVLILFVGTTWTFGGMVGWVRPLLAWWGSLGVLLTLTALRDREAWRAGAMRPLWWLVPMVAFNAVILAACLNPNLRELKFGAERLLALMEPRPGWPSSARPALAWRELWLFDALWISCFNVALVIRQRRALRLLLMVAAANACALAVFGTVQKFSGAKGLFFDAVPSPQVFFFSTFVYHNHWGAFMLLMIAASLGLVWHYGRRREARDFFHTPAFSGVVAIAILAATVPLSGSRSASLLGALLFTGTLFHWLVRIVQQRRRFRESIAAPLAGGLVAIALGGAGVWYVAKESIVARFAKTQEQFAVMQQRGSIGNRAILYRDTWRMAQARPWFGWGMASYPHVFTFYNTQESRIDRLPVHYHDAHSDWLQCFAEHGFVGTALLALCAVLPLAQLRPRHLSSPVPLYLLAGCALLLLYAWVEFPFGNVAVVLTWWLCYFCAVHYARLHDREPAAAASAAPR